MKMIIILVLVFTIYVLTLCRHRIFLPISLRLRKEQIFINFSKTFVFRSDNRSQHM